MTQEEAIEVLDELLKLERGLTGWELDFIESLNGQRDRDFSEKQIAVLQRLDEKLLK